MRHLILAIMALACFATTACAAGTTVIGPGIYGNISSAKAQIGSNKAILQYSTNQTVNNLTIPENIILKPLNGAVITVNSGKTLITPVPDAGARYMFAGSGTVLMTRGHGDKVLPVWWGWTPYDSSDTFAAANSTAFNAAATAAANFGGWVYLTPGTGRVVSVNVPNGVAGVIGPGVIKDSSSTAGATNGAVMTLGGGLSGSIVDGIKLSLKMSVTNTGTLRGITGARLVNSRIEGCDIAWSATPSSQAYAIDLRYQTGVGATSGVIITNNRIIMPEFADYTPRLMGVALVSNTTAYGGYFDNNGVTTMATLPVGPVTVSDNQIHGGSHAVSVNGGWRVSVTGNIITSPQHRGVIFEPAVFDSNITANVINEYGSSAILLTYGCWRNTVATNTCRTTKATGEGGIQALVGCKENKILGNTVIGPTWFGINVSVGAERNSIIGNHVSGFRAAGIAMEADWNNPVVNDYQRPNFGAPPTGSKWAFTNTQYNTVKMNDIDSPNVAETGAALYFAQINSYDGSTTYALSDNDIISNRVMRATNFAYQLYFWESTLNKNLNNTLIGNVFSYASSASEIFFSNGRSHFRVTADNDLIDRDYPAHTLADGDTTPSVAVGRYFVTSNTNPTSITYFDGGIVGQLLTLNIDANTTIVHGSGLILKGAANQAGGTNRLMTFRKVSTNWLEESRNF